MKSRHQRKTGKSRRRNRRLQRQLEVQRRASFESLEDRMLLAADLGVMDLPVAEGEASGHLYEAPTVHEAGEDYLSGTALGKTSMQVASEFFSTHANEYGLDPSGLGEFRVLSQYRSAHTRVTHLALQQQHNGLDVFGAMININLDNDGSVLTAASSFLNNLDQDAELTSVISVSPQQAVAAVANGLGLTLTENLNVISETTTGEMEFAVGGGGISSGPFNGRLVHVPTPNGVELGWEIHFDAAQGPERYFTVVDATDGQFALITDGVARASYRVIELPNNDPTDGPTILLTDPDRFSASPLGWHDTNGIEGAEFTITRGNNAHVVLGDLQDGFNSINYSPDGGDNLDFDFELDFNQSVFTQDNQNAILTNAFYTVNTLHDVTYGYGFDEAAGNFQATNYTGYIGGGDHMLVHAQDPSEGGAPPGGAFIVVAQPDGQSPRMMLSYTTNTNSSDAPTSRDFALENGVIAHEYGHGVLERLVGGPNYFSNYQQDSQIGAMHEGTGDYFGLMFLMGQSSAPDDAVELGKWTGPIFTPLDPDRVDPGVRRSAYSYDFAVNPITFDQWNDEDSPLLLGGATIPNNEVHNAGEIWAATLHDMTWELIAKYGGTTGAENFEPGFMDVAFNENLGDAVSKLAVSRHLLQQTLNGPIFLDTAIFSSTGPDLLDLTTGANNLAFQLVIDGMKLAPIQPSFTEMRDSIMAADIALTGGVNLDVIWKSFARRGLGFSSDPFNAGTFALPTTVPPFSPAYDLPFNPADITGTAFIDANEDGVHNLGESPLANTTIFIDLNNNGTRERLEPYTVSDDVGTYNFAFYTGGEFKIRALPVPDFVQTEPGLDQIPGGEPNDGSHHVFVVNGNSTSEIDFGFAPSAVSLGVFGTKYEDVNGNGVQDDPAIEKGLAGVYMYLDIDNDLRIDIGEPAAITDADGHYAIEFEQAGAYTVREVLAPGWATTEPAIGHHDITIIAGLPVLDINFGNHAQNDYGDAPAPYPTLIADGGAVHGILSGFSLGATVDSEIDGIPSGAADGDDLNTSDDEDGIRFNNDLPLVKGLNADIEVTVTNGSNSPGVVQGWIDYNADGDWNDAGEQVVIDQRVPEGTSTLTISVPEEATVGLTYARFRYGYERGIGPAGPAIVGEVEDYRILILDDNPVAIDDFFAVAQDSANNELAVLANDFASSTGALIIVGVGTPDQGGSVSITPDGSKLFYTPLNNFTTPPLESFTYTVGDSPTVDCAATPERCSTATVQVEVQTIFQDPVAVDDYRDVEGADANPPTTTIDVLANDIAGASGPLTLVPSGLNTSGTTGSVQVDVASNQILYTPAAGFYNLDSFSYTVSDTNNITRTANVTLQVSKAGGACSPDPELASCDDGINFIIETINPVTGTPLTQINVGQEFEVRVSVQDARGGILPADAGLYAAFMDVLYDADFVDVKPSATPIDYGANYTNFQTGVVGVPGVVNELGAVQEGFAPLGNSAIELASMVFIAKAAGTATIQLDPADVSPEHDSLVHEPATSQIVDHAIISYGTRTVTVNAAGGGGGGGEGELQFLDASGDGVVSPIDALQIINDLNTYGSRAVTPDAEGEIATPNTRFDVNKDNFISPVDALAVITYLNDHSAVAMQGGGEGEASADVIALLAADRYQVQSPVNSLTSNENSAAFVDTASQAVTIVDQPRQLETSRLDLGRWMTGTADADEAAGQDDLESLIDSLADDVAEQWNG